MAFYSLSLDLSTQMGSIAVHKHLEETIELLSSGELREKFQHSERVISEIDQCLKTAGITLNDVQDLVTTLGPGSFTGLRVALSVLKSFALALEKPIVAVHSEEITHLSGQEMDAKTLGLYYRFCKSKKVSKTLHEIAGLSPIYQGSRFTSADELPKQ